MRLPRADNNSDTRQRDVDAAHTSTWSAPHGPSLNGLPHQLADPGYALGCSCN
jgi:hypothetical protein